MSWALTPKPHIVMTLRRLIVSEAGCYLRKRRSWIPHSDGGHVIEGLTAFPTTMVIDQNGRPRGDPITGGAKEAQGSELKSMLDCGSCLVKRRTKTNLSTRCAELSR